MAKRSMMDDLLDQAMQEHAGELPLFDDIPIPAMQETMSAFRAKAGKKKKPRYALIIRYAAALILLVGVSAGIYAAFQSNLSQQQVASVRNDESGEIAEINTTVTVMDSFAAASGGTELYQYIEKGWSEALNSTTIMENGTYLPSFDRASPLFGEMPIYADKTPSGSVLTFHEEAEPPIENALTYNYVFSDGTIEITCYNADSASIQDFDIEFEANVDSHTAIELDTTVYILSAEIDDITTNIATWTNHANMLFIVTSKKMNQDTFLEYIDTLEWYEAA